jgi:hypothetical protein
MKKLALLCAMAGLTLLSGCGQPQTSTFHGTVSCCGKRLTSGVIFFRGPAPELRMGMGTIQDNGTYTATDVPVGEVRVAFQAPGVAAKYSDPNKSELIYAITPEMTSLDIEAP